MIIDTSKLKFVVVVEPVFPVTETLPLGYFPTEEFANQYACFQEKNSAFCGRIKVRSTQRTEKVHDAKTAQLEGSRAYAFQSAARRLERDRYPNQVKK